MFNVLDYTTSKEVSYIVKDNGNLLNDSSLTVNNSNEEVVSVEKAGNNYLITALTYGESKISFSSHQISTKSTLVLISDKYSI